MLVPVSRFVVSRLVSSSWCQATLQKHTLDQFPLKVVARLELSHLLDEIAPAEL